VFSQFIKEDSAINGNWHIPFTDGADKQLALLFVSTTNTIPTLVWLLLYILCDTSLAKELTNEISKVVTRKSDQVVLDISVLPQECPLLVSAYQKTLRLQKLGLVSLRKTRYSHLHPATVQTRHLSNISSSKEPWCKCLSGSCTKTRKHGARTPSNSTHRRFLKSKTLDVESNQQEKQQRRAYNPFGGGKHLCPGRHFAFAEILGTVAMLLLGFDIVAPEGMSLTVPKRRYRLGEGVAKPDGRQGEAMDVRVRRKQGWEKVKWTFDVGSLDK
jgi:hypothetical protein